MCTSLHTPRPAVVCASRPRPWRPMAAHVCPCGSASRSPRPPPPKVAPPRPPLRVLCDRPPPQACPLTLPFARAAPLHPPLVAPLAGARSRLRSRSRPCTHPGSRPHSLAFGCARACHRPTRGLRRSHNITCPGLLSLTICVAYE